MTKSILIITSGNVSKITDFERDGVTLASFRDVSYSSENQELFVNGEDIKNFGVIYFRMVGKSLEIATLVANYAKENGIQIVDRMYENTQLLPISLGKALEMKKLNQAGIQIPRTVFPAGIEGSGDFSKLNFPYVVKSKTGQKAREVWLVKNDEDLEKIKTVKFEKHKFYFAQELIQNAERVRVLTVGGKAIGAIKRSTKWNKSELKETLSPIPEDIAKLAVDSANAVNLDISGIDILINSETNEKYIIEANAAPAWKLINKYCGIKVEDEIIKFLQHQQND